MSKNDGTSAGSARKAGGRRRAVVVVLLALVIVLVIGVALAPMIASSLAPGIVQSAAKEQITGSVTVEKVSLGWFTPARVTGLRLMDEQGQQVAIVTAETQISLWQALRGRYWSAPALDVGTVTLSGSVDLVEGADGVTNLQRALAPAPSKVGTGGTGAVGTSGSGTGTASSGRAIKARLELDKLDLSRTAPIVGGSAPGGGAGGVSTAGVKGLAGTVDVDVDTRSGLVAKASGKLAGMAFGAGGPRVAGTSTTVDLTADVVQGPAGVGVAGGGISSLKAAKVNLSVQNAPVALVDGLAGLGGALLETAGEQANLTIAIDGNLVAMTANVGLTSPGLNAQLPLEIKGGVLALAGASGGGVGAGPSGGAGVISMRSSEGLSRLPQLRGVAEKLAGQASLTTWPSLEITLENLRVPSPVDAATGAARGLEQLDLRGASVVLKVRASAMAGQVLVPETGSGADVAAGGETARASGKGTMQAFTTEPLTVDVMVPDLAGGARIAAATRATLGGRPAGEVRIAGAASGLLDGSGRLRVLTGGGLADSLTAEVSLMGISTALLAPIVVSTGLPLDVATDIGPEASVVVQAKVEGDPTASQNSGSAGGGGLRALPRTTGSMQMTSANIQAIGAFLLEAGVLRSTGDGFRLTAGSIAGLAQRLTLDSNGNDPGTIAGGKGSVDARLTDVVVDLNALAVAKALPLSAIRADANIEVIDLRVRAPGGTGASGPPRVPPYVTIEPISISKLVLMANLVPGKAPAASIEGDMRFRSAAFGLGGGLTFEGLTSGALPTGNAIDQLLGLRPIGTVTLSRVPRTILAAFQGVPSAGVAAADASAVDPVALAKDLVGEWATISLIFAADEQPGFLASRLKIESQTGAIGASAVAVFAPGQVTVRSGSAYLKAEPATINAILGKVMPAVPNDAGNTARPMEVVVNGGAGGGENAGTVWLKIPKAIAVPLVSTDGALSADLSRVGEAVVTIAAEGEIEIRNIVLGGDGSGAAPFKYMDARVSGIAGQATLPAGGLAPGAKLPLAANMAMTVARGDGRAIGQARVDATALLDGTQTKGTVVLDNLGMATLDDTLALDGFLQGFVGETAKISLSTDLAGAGAAGAMTVRADVTAPRITGASISLVKTADRLALVAPARITLTPDAAFVNRIVDASAIPARAAEPAPSGGGAAKRDGGGGGPIGEAGRQIGGLLGGGGSDRRAAAPARARDVVQKLCINEAGAVEVNLTKLVLAMGAGGAGAGAIGPLKPGIFEVDASFGTQRLRIEMIPVAKDGSASYASTPIAAENVRGTAVGSGDTLNLSMTIDRLTSESPQAMSGGAHRAVAAAEFVKLDSGSSMAVLGTAFEGSPRPRRGLRPGAPPSQSSPADPAPSQSAPAQPAPSQPVQGQPALANPNPAATPPAVPAQGSGRASVINISLRNLADANGVINTRSAIVNAQVDVQSFPTVLLDRLGNQGGLLEELLGPTVSLVATARDVSQAGGGTGGGSLKATATAPRATLQLTGDVRDGQFIQSAGEGSLIVRLTEIRPPLVNQFAGSLPIVDSLEKTTADEPATIVGEGLQLSLDGDISKLSGKITIDPGVARFTTNNVFGQLLKAAGGRESGTIGRKIEPFVVTANRGILNYDRFKLPLGEFGLETQGEVDLVNRRLRLTTYVPFFALAEEATGPIKLGLGGKLDLINRNTAVPITTKGSLDSPETAIDVERFLKDLGAGIIQQPGKIIEDVLGDLFKDKKKK